MADYENKVEEIVVQEPKELPNAPKLPKGVKPELSPNPNDEGVVLKKGEQNNDAKVVDTESKKQAPKGDAWVKEVSEVLQYDKESKEVQVGTHLYADGDIESGGDVEVGRYLIVDDKEHIVDPDGNPIEFGGGTQLYKHTITNGDNSVKLVYYSEEQVLVSFNDFFITDLMNAFDTKNAMLVEGKYAPLGIQPKKILFVSIELQQPVVYAINSSLQASDIYSDLSIMTFNDEVVAL